MNLNLKINNLLLIIFISMKVNAQDNIILKNEKQLFPVKGDFSLNINAGPFIYFFDNLIRQSENTVPTLEYLKNKPYFFSGCYMKNDNLAYRLSISLGFANIKIDTLVPKIGSTNPDEKIFNESIQKTSNIELGFGVKKWRGKGRFRGFYGSELSYGLKTDKTKFTYGNELSAQNQEIRNTFFKPGNIIQIAINGYLGIEYYFSHKISLSGQFGFITYIQFNKAGELVREKWNGGAVEEIKTATGKSSLFSIDNDNSGGALNLNIYF